MDNSEFRAVRARRECGTIPPGRKSTALRSCLAALAVIAASGLAPAQARQTDLTELSLQDLMDVEVTVASKKPEKRFDVPDAIYVITQDDIRRSGVTSIPEALRLAPGVQVARIDANKWAIGIRGFASRLARSVLVLIDGRSVYTPLFAGTYWEVQDTLLEDVERIEVIRGAGGTLWGPNAFNGVINIITKRASETQGGLLSAGGGNQEQGFGGLRYGGKIDADTAYRVYGKSFHRAGFAGAGKQYDDWYMGRIGFRVDRDAPGPDQFTLQGDAYFGDTGGRGSVIRYRAPFVTHVDSQTDLAGGNLLGRWTRRFSSTSELALQTYYDGTYRNELNFREERHTVDVDMHHRFHLPWGQEIVWGLGYRVTTDATKLFSAIEFIPHGRTDNLFSGFVQDEIALLDSVHLMLGSKFEHNDYSGFEAEPSARLLWMPRIGHTVWAAISRAVRTPSRIEADVEFTAGPTNGVFPRIVGQHSFDAEKSLSYQLGYRTSPLRNVFVDVVAFYQHYDDLLSVEPSAPFQENNPAPPHVIFPLLISNGLHGDIHGVEIATDAVLADWWRINMFYAYLQVAFARDPMSHDLLEQVEERSAPHHTTGFQSKIDLPWALEFDSVFGYVDELPTQHVSSYFNFDARLAKHFGQALELSIVGQNLLAAQHREFGGGTEVVRGVYGQVRWWW